MIIVMKADVTEEQIQHVVDAIHGAGLRENVSRGEERTIIGAIGDERVLNASSIEAMSGVEKAMRILAPYKIASREFQPENTVIKVNGGDVKVGGKEVIVIAGPCAVEGEEQIIEIAQGVKAAGATILRGGAFKPRTGPYSFNGLEIEGLKMLAKAREVTGLPVITEVLSPDDVSVVAEYADILQIGARNMQNFSLLKAVGQQKKPAMLKRGMASTIEEFLLAAEHILSWGNHNIMLCERGIRTFETYTRNTVDINAVPALKDLAHLPVIVDPSHGTGMRKLVARVAMGAVAAGADGVMIEVHSDPEKSWVDGAQTLSIPEFSNLMPQLQKIAEAVGRSVNNKSPEVFDVVKFVLTDKNKNY